MQRCVMVCYEVSGVRGGVVAAGGGGSRECVTHHHDAVKAGREGTRPWPGGALSFVPVTALAVGQ